MGKHNVAVGLAALMACSMALTGCRTINKRLSESVLDPNEAETWEVHHYSFGSYIVDDEQFGEIDFAGWVEQDRVKVHYPQGLADAAEEIAAETCRIIETVEQRLGVAIITRTRIELLRFDEVPQNFDIRLTGEPNEFPLPLFVQTGKESASDILAHNLSYPYFLAHELVETSLSCDSSKGYVLPDIAWEFYFIGGHLNNDTRWFRDGLANYAGFVAYQTMHENWDASMGDPAGRKSIHHHPFSMLDAVGEDLFTWTQHSRIKQQGDYYDAALGLLLLIADEYGEQAIRDINGTIASRQSVDGSDLLKIAREITGADLKEVAASFRFPQIGAEVTDITETTALNKGLDVQQGLFVKTVEPNSLAATAGIEPNDAIVAVNGENITDYLDYELTLFKARRSPSATLSVWTAKNGITPVELDLGQVQAQERRKRRISTKNGRSFSVSIMVH